MVSQTGTGKERIRRPAPQRTEPNRDGWASDAPPIAEAEPPQVAPAIEQIVSDAVRIGYTVIEENLRQGRAAADRFGTGVYGVKDVPEDVGQIGRRVMQAVRDLSATWFDFLEASLRDPRFAAALKSRPVAPAPAGGKAGGRPPAAKGPVAIACSFPGKPAEVVSATLTSPEQLSMLAVPGLHSPDASAPPITSIVFLLAPGGIVASIRIPPDQPPGTYSGVICDAKTHAPLGTISIKVGE